MFVLPSAQGRGNEGDVVPKDLERDRATLAHAGDFNVFDVELPLPHRRHKLVAVMRLGDGGIDVAMDNPIGDDGWRNGPSTSSAQNR